MVDEDDFLYGGEPEKKSVPEPAPVRQQFDTKPDTQKIIANPAFTALLKSIGLDDLQMAQRIKVD